MRHRWIWLTLVVTLVGIGYTLRQNGLLHPEALLPYLHHNPLLARIFFLLLYAVGVVSTLPTLPFNLAAGFFWGPWEGALLATLGSSMGATMAFLSSRFILGQLLARHFDNRMAVQLQQEFNHHGWRFIAFARIVPVFPTGPFNYFLGLTSVGFATYLWTSLLFTFPPSLAFATIGHQAGGFLLEGDAARQVQSILVISLVVVILAAIRYWIRLRRLSP